MHRRRKWAAAVGRHLLQGARGRCARLPPPSSTQHSARHTLHLPMPALLPHPTQVPGGKNTNNYANVQLITAMAMRTGVDAVWPGW